MSHDTQVTIPSVDLVQAIAVAKVQAVENSIALCFRLKQVQLHA